MNAGIIVIMTIHVFAVAFNMAKHGEQKEGNWNGWYSLIIFGIWLLLYHWAGLIKLW